MLQQIHLSSCFAAEKQMSNTFLIFNNGVIVKQRSDVLNRLQVLPLCQGGTAGQFKPSLESTSTLLLCAGLPFITCVFGD